MDIEYFYHKRLTRLSVDSEIPILGIDSGKYWYAL